MTPPVDDPETLRRIFANTDALLLDFDGPICSVFSGIPAPIVADQLRDILAEGGHTQLPDDVRTATDPFDVLFYAAKLGPDEARYVEAAFRAHEVEAVQTAQPTPGAHDLIHAWNATGRPLAIVSNNSAAAITSYLSLHNMSRLVDFISARTNPDTSTLKPDAHLVTQAVMNLGIPPGRCVIIGDSNSDIAAGRAAGVITIGYANKPSKFLYLDAVQPSAVISTLSLLSFEESDSL